MTSSARCHQCGTRLARDNTDRLCHPCATTRASTCGVAAPLPPPGLWDRRDIHAALRDGHIGRLFRAFRHAHTPPITQEQLAEWVQLTQGQISIIERQRRPITDLERLERWCDALHVPARLRWFRAPSIDQANSEPGVENDTVIVPLPRGGASIVLSRRELLAGLGVGITAGALHATFDTALDGIPADAGTLRTFETAYDNYQMAARSCAPSALVDGMLGNVAILDALRRRATRLHRPAFLRLLARYAESLSWLHEESSDIDDALYWIDRASQWAHAANWPAMTSYGFVRRSMMAISFTSDGARAVDNARTVLDHNDATPRLRGLASKQLAFGHALAGDQTASYRALDRAMHLLDQSATDEDAVLGQRSVVTDDLFAIFRATCDLYLGRGAQVVDTLQPTLDALATSSTRTATITRAKLARAYAHAGEPAHVAALGSRALDDIDRIHSASARSELHRAVPALRTWNHRGDIQILLTRLATVSA